MKVRGEQPRERGKSGKTYIPEKVAQFYYTYGLFSSSWPVLIITFSLTIVIICCYPLINLPLPGSTPFEIHNVSAKTEQFSFCYVQQVVLRVAVLPWESHMTLGDAFRAPLYEAFKLLEAVQNYHDESSSKNLGHVCLHIEAIRRIKAIYHDILPQYSCLVLSPANFWQQDVQQFAQDNSILTTIFNHQNFQKGKTSIAEMLFGMNMVDTGIKRYPFRNRPRVIQYAITIFLKENDERFVEGLRKKLYKLYPLYNNDTPEVIQSNNDTVLIQYPGEINYLEFVPITLAFVILFCYYYFSVRKIEVIRSKLTMTCAVVITVLGSLVMTLGICFFFGLTLSLQGKEIFPYLIILVGIENVLVLTKSIVSTPAHLDVKIRVAQGLSKEGWSIMKNLLLEITILTFGLFTFVPKIQEFCIFAIVGLLTDLFLQMGFFIIILGWDMKRAENLNESRNPNFRSNLFPYIFSEKHHQTLGRSKSHPRLSSFPTSIVAGQAQGMHEKKIPKRVWLVNVWARTRFFQRAFMILMAIWIGIIAYDSDILENYFLNFSPVNNTLELQNTTVISKNYDSIKVLLPKNRSFTEINYVTRNPLEINLEPNQTTEFGKLKHPEYETRKKLSLTHWSSILNKYNLSLSGRHITILPTIKLSHIVAPNEALTLRNPNEKYGQSFNWHALSAALDPIEFGSEDVTGSIPKSEQPYYPSTPMEIFFTTILCLVSIIVLSYIFYVLYRCICSRNYAEWRASWFNHDKNEDSESEHPVLLEAVPVTLEGHLQEIECISTDGLYIVSSCLNGILKIWDSNGDIVSCIDRGSFFGMESKYETVFDFEDGMLSDYESGSPPSRDENTMMFPKLMRRINTNFSNIKEKSSSPAISTKYNFNESFKQLYLNRRTPPSVAKTNPKEHLSPKPRSSIGDPTMNYENCISPSSPIDLKKQEGRSLSSQYLNNKLSPIWCLDYVDNLIVVGCADGRMEFWEGTSAKLKCVFEDGSDVGITNVKIIGSRVVASRLFGTLDFFLLQTYNQGRPIDWNFTCAYRRTHVRTGSFGSLSDHKNMFNQNDNDEMKCLKVLSIRAHQQPITCLECEGSKVVTGSQDHTLKVFKMDDGTPLYTLHGHCGPITCMFIDNINPATSGSGSQDGMLCVWDLITGTCMYNIQAHDGSITSLTYSSSYVISLGTDDRLCVWERFQGHLLNTIPINQTFYSPVVMLAPHIVITARSECLNLWDVRSGDCVRSIPLGRTPYVFVKKLILLRDAVLCDYGNQLRLVRFPLITRKFD